MIKSMNFADNEDMEDFVNLHLDDKQVKSIQRRLFGEYLVVANLNKDQIVAYNKYASAFESEEKFHNFSFLISLSISLGVAYLIGMFFSVNLALISFFILLFFNFYTINTLIPSDFFQRFSKRSA